MSYDYKTEKPHLYSEEGLSMFTQIRDRVRRLLHQAGACAMGRAVSGASGDSWMMLACVDRMVELEELREVGEAGRGQDRVFVPGPKWKGEK